MMAEFVSSLRSALQKISSSVVQLRTTRVKHVPAFGLYFAEAYGADPTGVEDSTAEINQCLAENGSVYLVGTYRVSGPILINQIDQKLILCAGATLLVESGYTGDVIRVGGSVSTRSMVIQGTGCIIEEGKSGGSATVPSLYTGIRFFSVAGIGTTAILVDGIQIKWPGTAVAFEVQGNGWINGNKLTNMHILYPRVYFDFVTPGSGTGYSGNTIENVMGQSGNYVEYGIKNLYGSNWILQNVSLWDIANSPAAISCEINAAATNTKILGGLATFQNFNDNGTIASGQTIIEDPYQTRPWMLTQFFRPSELTPRTNPQSGINGSPTLTMLATDWPVWSFPESNSGLSFIYRLPNGVTKLQVSLIVMDLTGNTGPTYWGVAFQAGPGAGVSTVTATINNPSTGAISTVDVPLKSTLVGGTTYRITVTRTASNAADTLVGAMGLVGLLVKPIK